jgi:membrane protease YdiL (CAAX protease family)
MIGVQVAPISDAVSTARRGVVAYLVVVALLSAVVDIVILRTREVNLALVLMCMPALACVAVRLVRHEGFGDVSFRFGGLRTWLAIGLALLLPFVVGLLAYVPAWLSGLATFGPSPTGSLGDFQSLLWQALTLGLLLGLPFAFGEELGWRGYLVPRLLDARVPYPLVVSGVIWGAWHLPLIFAGLYASGSQPALSGAIFMAVVIPAAILFAWLRLATGSLWPAVVAHAAWNSIIQDVLDKSTQGDNAALWTGESGLLTAVVLVVLALLATALRLTKWRTPTQRFD